MGIAIGVGIHAIYHLVCDFTRLLDTSDDKYELMEPFFGSQPHRYWYFVKLVEGITGIVMVVLMAIAFTLGAPWFRRNRLKLPNFLKKLSYFNAFWYSHHLLVIVFTFLIVHEYYLYLNHDWYKKMTWMYLVVPIILYACERLSRELRSSIRPIIIQKVAVWLFILEMCWHFSCQSLKDLDTKVVNTCLSIVHPYLHLNAPGDDYLSVHILTLGD